MQDIPSQSNLSENIRDVTKHFVNNKLFYSMATLLVTSGTGMHQVVSVMSSIRDSVTTIESKISRLDKSVLKHDDLVDIASHLKKEGKVLPDMTADQLETIFMKNDWKERQSPK
jgi:hypothetical protein